MNVVAPTTATIRKATPVELENLFGQTGDGFYEERNIPGKFDVKLATKNWSNFFVAMTSVVLVAESYDEEYQETNLDGLLGAVITPDLYDGRKVATEMFMYTVPSASVWAFYKLLKAYHKWASENGAVETRLTHMISDDRYDPNGDLERIYRKMGYRQLEVSYVREIEGGA